ncbi:MAG: hypothetical protein U1E22_02260 [Coriobacteriia bacterium]|nr:hypothetical protein [Coriobacteriia bacterium]
MVAAVDYSRVARAAAAVQEQAGNLAGEFAKVRIRDFPNEDAAELAGVLLAACKELANRASEVGEAAAASKNNAALLARAFRLLGRYNQIVRLVHIYLSFLRDAEVYTLPSALSGLLRKKLSLIDPDAHVYMHADDEYNYYYSPIGRLLKEVLESGGLTTYVNEKFGVVAFPKSESGSTLKCTLLAHEVGHYIYDFRQLDAEVVQAATHSGDWQRAEACLTTQFIDAKGQLQLDQPRMQHYWSIVFSWLQEFASDRIAIHLLGPAFVLAWLDYTVAMDDNGDGETHPSPANRIDVLWSWLRADSNPWSDTIVSRLEPRIPWVSAVRSKENLMSASIDWPADPKEAIRGAAKILLPHIAAVVDGVFPSDSLLSQASDYSEKADEAFELLGKGVPPGEVLVNGSYSALLDSTALLVGWMFLLDGLDTQWGDFVEKADQSAKHHAISCLLDEHVAKAAEVIALRSAWMVNS